MLQPRLWSPIKGLHTQAPSNVKAPSFTHTHTLCYPSNETGGLSVGTDGFTTSIDGCLEGVKKKKKKESWRSRVSETERERERERDGAAGLLRR